MQSSPKGRRGVAQVFHRLASSTQTNAVAKMQVGSCELWGDHPIHPYLVRRHIVMLYRRLSGGSSSRLPLAHVRATGRPTKRAGITPKIRAFDVTVSDMRSSIFQF